MLSGTTLSHAEEQVVAYRYKRPIDTNDGHPWIYEYFIPSEKISFTEKHIERTNDLDQTLSSLHWSSAVTRTYFFQRKFI